jgi:4-amino-4-deoxy-L-arabinose transferase-like glycosyltransferase
MLFLLLSSSQEDTLVVDELPHITAGYAYLRFRDARLNPEHPPLLKLLAALPLLPMELSFPRAHASWQNARATSRSTPAPGQWEVARVFLYELGNNPYHIAARARLAPILLTVALGLVLFLWTRAFGGAGAALVTLFFYAFSPTILAHGRYVTTDVAAAFGVALAGFAIIQFLGNPRCATAVKAGLAMGVALLCKFSTVLLVPFFAVLTLLSIGLRPGRLLGYLSGLVITGVSGALLVLLPYVWITAHYPPEQQLWDTYFAFFATVDGPAGRMGQETPEAYFATLLNDRTRDLRACVYGNTNHPRPRLRCPAEITIFLADKPVLRAWGEYLFGIIWIVHRVKHSARIYFLGDVTASGSALYFPIVYMVKEPLPFLLLTALALSLALGRVWISSWGISAFLRWVRVHPAETVMLGWIALYWSVALGSQFNIGIRHLLPVMPFTIILVARECNQWLTRTLSLRAASISWAKVVVVALALIWQVLSVLSIYPSFLAYFNEGVGGPDGGVRYVVDSNLDWGQDLGRLRTFVSARQIETIAVDYFGGGSPLYELGEKFIRWEPAFGPYHGWLAVSATKLYQASIPPTDQFYEQLRVRSPVAKIGYSIFVYDLRDRK